MTSISADGRWGGRLTRRPLPEGDPSLDALDATARRDVTASWLARSATERCVGDSFAVIHAALKTLGAERDLVVLAERAIDDEMRHAELCRAMASRYAGRELEPPAELPLRVPKHEGASPELTHRLHVVGQCCMNETLASAFLEASVATTSGQLARAALRELLSDEIDHARLGWAYLASLGERDRGEIGPWLFGMMRANLAIWRNSPRGYAATEAAAAQGVPRAEVIEDALRTAIGELIVPGLDQLGLPTQKIRAWLDGGAPT
jgi:hypothetical protein